VFPARYGLSLYNSGYLHSNGLFSRTPFQCITLLVYSCNWIDRTRHTMILLKRQHVSTECWVRPDDDCLQSKRVAFLAFYNTIYDVFIWMNTEVYIHLTFTEFGSNVCIWRPLHFYLTSFLQSLVTKWLTQNLWFCRREWLYLLFLPSRLSLSKSLWYFFYITECCTQNTRHRTVLYSSLF
jgi:hypothetical protein